MNSTLVPQFSTGKNAWWAVPERHFTGTFFQRGNPHFVFTKALYWHYFPPNHFSAEPFSSVKNADNGCGLWTLVYHLSPAVERGLARKAHPQWDKWGLENYETIDDQKKYAAFLKQYFQEFPDRINYWEIERNATPIHVAKLPELEPLTLEKLQESIESVRDISRRMQRQSRNEMALYWYSYTQFGSERTFMNTNPTV